MLPFDSVVHFLRQGEDDLISVNRFEQFCALLYVVYCVTNQTDLQTQEMHLKLSSHRTLKTVFVVMLHGHGVFCLFLVCFCLCGWFGFFYCFVCVLLLEIFVCLFFAKKRYKISDDFDNFLSKLYLWVRLASSVNVFYNRPRQFSTFTLNICKNI